MGINYISREGMNEEVQFKDIVSENENYFLVIGKMKDTAYDSYLAVNRSTGVIEGTQQVLSTALDMVEALDKWIRQRDTHVAASIEAAVKETLEEVTDGVFE